MEDLLEKPKEVSLEKSASSFFEKGGKRAIMGEIRNYSGREYQKTQDGWKIQHKVHQNVNSAHSIGAGAEKTSNTNLSTQITDRNQHTSYSNQPDHKESSDEDKTVKAISSFVGNPHKVSILYGHGSDSEKTNIVSKVLQNKKEYNASQKPGDSDYDYVRLHSVSSHDLYKSAYEHNGKTLVFKSDSGLGSGELAELVSDIASNNELKTDKGLTDYQGNLIPPSFKFTGKLIITSSLNSSDIPLSIRAKATSLDMSIQDKNKLKNQNDD